MPISKENKKLYPSYWKYLSYWIRFKRAEGYCECKGECGQKHFWTKDPSPDTRCAMFDKKYGGGAVLTVAHLDHNPANNSEKNLKAYFEGCHLRYDSKRHQESRKKNSDKKRGVLRLI